MKERIQIDQVEPCAYHAIFKLEEYLSKSNLSQNHKNLIKIKASQLNGCGFCIDMHTKEALKNGEDPQRIFLLDAWQKTDLFSEGEKIILQVTEEVTLIHKKGLTNETYLKAIETFDENYFAQIIMAISTINVWNRVAISTLTPF